MSEENTKRNQLNAPQMFKLAAWLHTVEEKLKGEGPPHRLVAEWASKELGFRVTENNLLTVCEAGGITWEARVPRPRGGTLLKKRMAELEAAVANQAAAVKAATGTADRAQLFARSAEQKVRQSEEAMQSRIRGLDADLAIMRELVYHLYRDLGSKPPAGHAIPTDASRLKVVGGTAK